MTPRPVASATLATAALAAGLVVASCIVQAPPPRQSTTLPANSYQQTSAAGDAPGGLSAGDYSCTIETDGYRYPPFHCAIYVAEDGSAMLEKLSGSQRFRGRLDPSADQDGQVGGFHFAGTYFCPWGACTDNVSGDFAAQGPGVFRGTLQGSDQRVAPVTVTLTYLPGGFTYGGAGYGGVAYGGRGYGRTGYATPPPPPSP